MFKYNRLDSFPMKLIIRERGDFLEVKLKDGTLVLTGEMVNPANLVHFGTDIIGWHEEVRSEYLDRLDKEGVDYLFISKYDKLVDHHRPLLTELRVVTSYKKR